MRLGTYYLGNTYLYNYKKEICLGCDTITSIYEMCVNKKLPRHLFGLAIKHARSLGYEQIAWKDLELEEGELKPKKSK